MPIRTGFMIVSIALLLSACGGGGGGSSDETSSIAAVPDYSKVVMQVGDVIPLSSMHISDQSIDVATSTGSGFIEVSNGNLIAKSEGSGTFSVNSSVGSANVTVTVCAAVYTGVTSPAYTADSPRINNIYANNDISRAFTHKDGVAIKVNTSVRLAHNAACNESGVSGIDSASSGFYPPQSIDVNGKHYAAGEKVSFATPGQYTATFNFYNGDSKEETITVFNSVTTQVAQTPTLQDKQTGEILWLEEGGTRPAAFTLTTDTDVELDVTQIFQNWGDGEFKSYLVGVSDTHVNYVVPDASDIEMIWFDKNLYNAAINEVITYKVYAKYKGDIYDVTQISRIQFSSDDNNYVYSKLVRINPGSLKFTGAVNARSATFGIEQNGSVEFDVGPAVPSVQQGRWNYVASGKSRWIGSNSASAFTTIDTNMLKDNADNSILIRAGISNVEVSGTLDSLLPLTSATVNSATKAARSGLSGIGGIDVILQNLESGKSTTVQTDVNGNFNAQVETGEYLITSETNRDDNGETQVVKIEANATVDGESTDIGNFTLTPVDDYNFKASLLATDLAFFGYSTQVIYSRNIRITNTGAKNISGARARISVDYGSGFVRTHGVFVNGQVVSTDADGYFLIGGIAAKNSSAAAGTYDIELRIAFYEASADTNIPVTVDIKDSRDYVWTDRVQLPLSASKAARVKIYARNGNAAGNVNGYIVTPGRTLVRLSVNSTDPVYYDVPFKVDDSYQIILSNNGVSTESAYSLGIATTADITSLQAFTDVNRYESGEGDNSAEFATPILYGEEKQSYLLTDDVDFYRFDMTAETAP